MKILDVGCGSGGFIEILKEKGFENVYGVEPSKELLSQGSNPNIKHGFSTILPFDNESFDCIYFFNVLHHVRDIEDYRQTIQETNRCLKPGGLIIMLEPCNEFIYTAKRFVSKLLGPVSKTFATIYQMMMEEKEDVTYFFKNYKYFKECLLNLDYNILRDQKILHQWIFVVKKNFDNTKNKN